MSHAKKNDKYEKILEASIRVLARNGYQHSTVSQIAREAGVGDGTIYLYFKNKDDLLDHFFSYKTTQIFSRYRQEVDKAKEPLEKLSQLVYCHLKEFEQNKDMAIVYESETRRRLHLSDEKLRQMSRMYFDLVAEIVQQGQQEGKIRPHLQVQLVKQFIIGAIDEVVTTWLYSSREYRLTSMAEPLVDLFVNGIGSAETRAA